MFSLRGRAVLLGALLVAGGCVKPYDDFGSTLSDKGFPAQDVPRSDSRSRDQGGEFAADTDDFRKQYDLVDAEADVVPEDGGKIDLADGPATGDTTDTPHMSDVPCEPSESAVEYLCASCNSDDDCGCGAGVCWPYRPGTFCLLDCGEAMDCPSGYVCSNQGLCTPLGGKCGGCVAPDGCGQGQTCDFESGACIEKVPVCGTCTFDYECGFDNRCWPDGEGGAFCAPECDKSTFSCPLSSGCEMRDGDGALVCVFTGQECCYGLGCDTCTCVEPAPICLEDGGCAQCLSEFDCPPGKPVCELTTHTCIIQCQGPTPVYWKDPETGAEYCVQCATSKDCPEGTFCGTFEADPETYHKCYLP